MIVIVGGTGRLGRLVARGLVAAGRPVRVVSRHATPGAVPGAETVAADVRDPAAIRAACAGAGVVVSAMHGFAGTGGDNPAAVDRAGNAHLVDAAGSLSAEVVLTSIAGARADSPMELFRMKHAAERYLWASGVPGTVVRPGAFLEMWLEILRSTAARSGRPVVFGRGANPINFVSVRDVAALLTHVVLDPGSRGATLDIGGPEPLTFNRLAAAVQAADGRDAPPRHVPVGVLRVAAATLGRLRPALGRQLRSAVVMDSADLAHVEQTGRAAYPDIPLTTLDGCLLDPVP